ncbi:MAG: CHAT domain-containing protein, partial [Myxococcales bacterium]|nr:CHAT domain-containing protein [Myxococcales bacterium]
DQAVGRLLRAGRLAQAFAVADSGRARVLRAAQAPARLAGLAEAQRQAWAARLEGAALAAEALRAHGTKAALVPEDRRAAWATEQARLEAAHDAAFEGAYAWLDAVAPIRGDTGATAAETQSRLAVDEALLAFARTPAGWRVFVLDRDRLTVHAADPGHAWPGVFARVDQYAHLYVVPGGHPQGFAAFNRGDEPPALRWTVSWLPHAGLLAQPSGEAGAAVVIGDPNHDLQGAFAEGRAVAEALGGVRLLRGQATVAAVRSALASAATIHFAGHGVLGDRDPWAAHLQLADGVLGLPDLLTLPLAGRPRVVLSGCETGVDAVLLDERAVGLAEAFLAAGAVSVVATDRPVADGAALAFMKLFYESDGATQPARAAQSAARALRANGNPHWSAFRVIGRR